MRKGGPKLTVLLAEIDKARRTGPTGFTSDQVWQESFCKRLNTVCTPANVDNARKSTDQEPTLAQIRAAGKCAGR